MRITAFMEPLSLVLAQKAQTAGRGTTQCALVFLKNGDKNAIISVKVGDFENSIGIRNINVSSFISHIWSAWYWTDMLQNIHLEWLAMQDHRVSCIQIQGPGPTWIEIALPWSRGRGFFMATRVPWKRLMNLSAEWNSTVICNHASKLIWYSLLRDFYRI